MQGLWASILERLGSMRGLLENSEGLNNGDWGLYHGLIGKKGGNVGE